jgi:hypothetical protein
MRSEKKERVMKSSDNRSVWIPAGVFAVVFAVCAGCGRTVPDVQKPIDAGEAWSLHAYSWEPPAPGVRNVSGFIWIDLSENGRHSYALDPDAAAELSRKRAPGRAVLFIWQGHDLIGDPADRLTDASGRPCEVPGARSPWPEHKIAIVAGRVEMFFTAFKAAGGRLDFLVLDQEENLSMWGLNEAQIRAIWEDPRFEPYRAQIGDPAGVLHDRNPPSYRVGDDLAHVVAEGDKPYMKWNRIQQELYNASLNRAVYEPVRKLYPDARASNYDSYRLAATDVVTDVNGHLTAGLDTFFGNRASPQLYGYGQFAHRPREDGTAYGHAPFDILRWQVNNARAFSRSNPGCFLPWISHKSWTGDIAFPHQNHNNDYYQELVYHLALMGVDDLLLWNPAPWYAAQDTTSFRKESDDLVLDACLENLNRAFAGKRPEPLSPQDPDWNSPLLVTGARIASGKSLWRVTVPAWYTKVRVMPRNIILETGKLSGLWYEASAGETPVFSVAQ